MSLRIEGDGNVFLNSGNSKKTDNVGTKQINIEFSNPKKEDEVYPGTELEKTNVSFKPKETYDKNGKLIQREEKYYREDNGKLCTQVKKIQRNDKGQVVDESVSFDGVQNMHSTYAYDDAGNVTSRTMYSGNDKDPFEKYEFNQSGQLKTRIQYQNIDGKNEEFGRWERTYANSNDKFCTKESFVSAKNGITCSEASYDPKTGEEIKTIYYDPTTGEKDGEKKGKGYRLPEEIIPK